MCPWVQELTEAIPVQEVVLGRVNSAGEDISQLSKPDDALRLRAQLKSLNTRWANVCQHLNERKRRCVCVCLAPGPMFVVLWYASKLLLNPAYFPLHSCFPTVFFFCRSAEARTVAAELQEDTALMLGWLDKAEGTLAIPLQPAEPQHIRDTLNKTQVPSQHNTLVIVLHLRDTLLYCYAQLKRNSERR